MNDDKVRYLAYGRVSSEEQRNNSSVGNQFETIEVRMVRLFESPKLIKKFSDVASARSDKRPGLQSALSYAKWHNQVANEPLTHFVVSVWDRFFRNTSKSGKYSSAFKDIGVEVNAVEEWVNFNDSGDVVLHSVRQGIAEGESIKNGNRTKAGMRAKMRAGYWVFNPKLGYRSTGLRYPNEAPIIVPDEEVARAKVRLLSFVAGGMNIKSAHRQCGGREVLGSYNNLMDRLFDPFDLGLIDHTYPDGVRVQVQGRHAPIVTKELQLAAYRAYQKGKRQTKVRISKRQESLIQFPLRQIIRCPQCGGGCTSSTPLQRNGQRAAYYSCSCGKCKPGYNLRRDITHELAAKAFSTIKPSQDTIKELNDMAKKDLGDGKQVLTTEINALIKKHEAQQKRLQNAVNLRLDGELSTEDLRLTRRIADQIEEDLNEARASLVNYEAMQKQIGSAFENIGQVLSEAITNPKSQQMAIQANHFLTMLFPDGICYHKQSNTFRTGELNRALVGTGLITVDYTCISTGFPVHCTGNPEGGRKAGLIRTLATDRQSVELYLRKYNVA